MAGGKIHLSEGLFTVGATININVTNILLSGSGKSTLVRNSAAVPIITVADGSTTGAHIRDMYISSITGANRATHGILAGASYTTIENVYVTQPNVGIEFNTASTRHTAQLSNILVQNTLTIGILLAGIWSRFQLNNITIITPTTTGIYSYRSGVALDTRDTFNNITVYDPTVDGIFAKYDRNQIWNNVQIYGAGHHGMHLYEIEDFELSNFIIDNPEDYGLYIVSEDDANLCQNVNVSNGHVYNTNNGPGLCLYYVKDSNITNVTLEECGTHGSGQNPHGIWTRYCERINFTNVHAYKSANHGMLATTATDFKLVNCSFRDNSQGDSGNWDGINIVDGDRIDLVSVSASNKDGATQRYGINIASAVDDVRITKPTLRSNATAPILNASTTVTVDQEPISSVLDLSGASSDVAVFYAKDAYELIGYAIIYTEASSADAGVEVRVGKYSDTDYFDASTSEVSKSLGYAKEFVSADLSNTTVAAGDVVTVGIAGSKTGTGEVIIKLYLVLV